MHERKDVLIMSFIAFMFTCVMTASGAELGPSVVKILKTGDTYQLERNGKPYFIKGAGGKDHLEELVAAGGNSIRTWGVDGIGQILDRAQKLGLTVTVGIWLGHERHGFKYSDAKTVTEQLEMAKRNIQQYKNHPALLMWGIGNEMEGDGKNTAIWKAINDIAKAAKQIDPNHPVMTVIAEVGSDKIKNLNECCPDIDIVGINTYGGIQSMRKRYVEAGGIKPFVVTEFGPPGQWEVPKNECGAPVEMNSTAKAEWYMSAYQKGIAAHKDLCLGSYVFIWGFKQEATATWFGLFLKDGARLATVESMVTAWGGKPPVNRCPVISDITLDKDRGLKKGDVIHASWKASDPDGDPLNVKWVLRREAGQHDTGGDEQPDQPEFPDSIVESNTQTASIRIPESGGPYRLFGYAYDGKGNAAVANVRLHVEGKVLPPPVPVVKLPFSVYSDGGANQPYVPSGYMGNTSAISMDPNCTNNPHGGNSCIKVVYNASDNWGGVVWQSPANDWGKMPGGYNLTGATDLEFWARGEAGGEVMSFMIGILAKDSAYPDSEKVEIKDIHLTDKWLKYRIPLDGRNISVIKTGFGWSLAGQGKPIIFYLDDIRYVEKN